MNQDQIQPQATPKALIHFHPERDDSDANPTALYRQLLSLDSIPYWVEGDGWLISKHSDLVAMMREPRLRGLTSLASPIEKAQAHLDLFRHFIETHPYFEQHPPFDRFKRDILKFSGSEKMELLESSFIAIADDEIGRLGKRFDLVSDYCSVAAIRMIACMIGVTETDFPVFLRFANALRDLLGKWNSLSRVLLDQNILEVEEGVKLLKSIFARRRLARRREIFVDVMLTFSTQETAIQDEELLHWIGLMVIDALEKITLLSANTLYHLCRDRRAGKFLRKNPQHWRNAILEAFRYDCFVKMGSPRVAAEDIVLGGQNIKRGEIIYPIIAAAMMDEAAFEAPGELNIQRSFENFPYWAYDEFGAVNKNLVLYATQIICSRLFKSFPNLRTDIFRNDADASHPWRMKSVLMLDS